MVCPCCVKTAAKKASSAPKAGAWPSILPVSRKPEASRSATKPNNALWNWPAPDSWVEPACRAADGSSQPVPAAEPPPAKPVDDEVRQMEADKESLQAQISALQSMENLPSRTATIANLTAQSTLTCHMLVSRLDEPQRLQVLPGALVRQREKATKMAATTIALEAEIDAAIGELIAHQAAIVENANQIDDLVSQIGDLEESIPSPTGPPPPQPSGLMQMATLQASLEALAHGGGHVLGPKRPYQGG
mgnify:CR=1 FL=1